MTPPIVPGVPARAASYLVATYATRTAREQAEALGVTHHTVLAYRSLLVRAGLLDPARRAEFRRYTEAERERAARLARQGLTLQEIADALGRPVGKTSQLLAPLGGIRRLRAEGRADAWFSAEQAAVLMGVHPGTIRDWLAHGALVADRTKPQLTASGQLRKSVQGNRHGVHRITRAALCEFVRERSWWMTYGVRGIQDQDIRQLAETVRRAARGAWVKLRSVAPPVSTTTYVVWRAEGWPGPGWEVIRRGTADWLWLPEGSAPPEPRPTVPHAVRSRRKSVYPKIKTCVSCGAPFAVTRQTRHRTTCGAGCRAKRLRRAA